MKPRRFLGLAVLIAAASVSAACGSDLNREAIFLSPDGSVIADWYSESGGGAAGWSNDLVQLRFRSERFRFKDDVVFRGGGSNGRLRIVWKSKNELEISYPKLAVVMSSTAKWNDISITHREDAELGDRLDPSPYHFSSAASPDEQYEAVWHQNPDRGDARWLEDCVQLIPAKYDPSLKLGENCSFVGISGDNLKMKWSTAKHLYVSYPLGTTVTKADPKWNDVTITYAEDPKLQKY